MRLVTLKPAAAWLAPNCDADSHALQCRLLSWLGALQVAAVILGVLLVVAVIFTFVVFRRNQTRQFEKTRRP